MISIVVPTCNEDSGPMELEQFLWQIGGILDVVFVDASDEPESRKIVDFMKAGERSLIVHADRKGRGAQMNQGARLCRGEAVLFLHCDTRLPSDAAALIADALEERCWGRFDIRLDSTGWRFRLIEFMINLRSRVTRIATGDQAIFVQRRFFLEHGGFAEIPLMEDIEFCRRIGASRKPALITTPVITSARRWISNGTLRTILLMWKLRIFYRLGVDPEQLAAMYRMKR